MRRLRLSARFTLLLSLIIIMALGAFMIWSYNSHRTLAEQKALAEAQVLKYEMTAIWDYISENQDRINYNSDGNFDFKGVYCTIAGKNIAQRYMRQTEYTIRFVRENPRSGTDIPDSFEQAALRSFQKGGSSEYYAVDQYEGRRSVRYVSVLRTDANCLSCHGEPAGEFDLTGFRKEGFQLGDLAGAMSIVVPLDIYDAEANKEALKSMVYFAMIVLAIVIVTRFALRSWVVKPISELENAAREVGRGNLEVDVENLNASGEIGELADDFRHMATKLKSLYSSLESQVEERTSELAYANAELEKNRGKLEKANATLVDMNQRLKEESEHKTKFLAIMNHELKTPLTAIVAVVEIWEKTRKEKTSEDLRLMQEIKTNCLSLLSMIENTVDVARLEAGRFEMLEEEVDLIDVVNTVLELASPLAEKRHIHLNSEISEEVPVIISDEDMLHKILMNLVSNAIKFAQENGEVQVVVMHDELSSEIVISVSDDGIGIADEEKERIFERFTQSDSSISRKYGGSGLGLALVKELSEMLGGRVELISIPDEGSVFIVFLPTIGEAISLETEGCSTDFLQSNTYF